MQKPFDSAEYRHRATGARATARQMPTECAKAVMSRIAEDYERMAELRAQYEAEKRDHQPSDAH